MAAGHVQSCRLKSILHYVWVPLKVVFLNCWLGCIRKRALVCLAIGMDGFLYAMLVSLSLQSLAVCKKTCLLGIATLPWRLLALKYCAVGFEPDVSTPLD